MDARRAHARDLRHDHAVPVWDEECVFPGHDPRDARLCGVNDQFKVWDAQRRSMSAADKDTTTKITTITKNQCGFVFVVFVVVWIRVLRNLRVLRGSDLPRDFLHGRARGGYCLSD